MRPIDADRALRKVSELRRLCRRLPHLPTAAEQRLPARFDAIVRAPSTATSSDVAAITAGWRGWWRAQRFADIVTMAARLPAGFVDDDRELAGYAVAAETARPSGRA